MDHSSFCRLLSKRRTAKINIHQASNWGKDCLWCKDIKYSSW